MKTIIKRVRAPVRIDFAGGTTDIKYFCENYKGVVLNAAINRYIEGKLIATDKKVGLEYSGNVPTSSGLGTSGVMNVVWYSLISNTKNKFEIAEKIYEIEQAMGLVGGKQDQYAACFGGINYLEFEKEKVKLKQLKLKKNIIKQLEEKLVLVYTGKPHFSGDSNKLMMKNLIKGKNKNSLLRIRDIAKEMKNALEKGDLYLFSNLLNHETKERRKLASSIIPFNIEKLIKKGLNNGASSVKICGSGGGGSLLFYADDKKKLMKVFNKNIIDFKFDFEGLKFY